MPVRGPNLPDGPPERESEDDQASAALGGQRGDPSLSEATMTPQRRKKTLVKDEPEHTA